MCRVCVSFHRKPINLGGTSAGGGNFILTVRKAIRETLWLLIESPEGGHASTLPFSRLCFANQGNSIN
jgi:hypothetical protein